MLPMEKSKEILKAKAMAQQCKSMSAQTLIHPPLLYILI